MSAPLVVAALLVAGWNLTLTFAAFLTGTGPFQSAETNDRDMTQSRVHVEAEIGTPDLDARTNAWRRGASVDTAEYVRSRVADTSQQVTVPAPYAKASVTVVGEEGDEARRCSLCMN
jgi:hypothetical protein